MRVCCDTNVLVRAVTRPGSPAQEVAHRIRNSAEHVLILSTYILEETERVLRYPGVVLRAQVSAEEAAQFVVGIARIAELIELTGAPTRITADEDDDIIVQTAVIAQADVLCTLDRHFFDPDVRNYCQRHNVEVLDDVTLLGRIRDADNDEAS